MEVSSNRGVSGKGVPKGVTGVIDKMRKGVIWGYGVT